MVELVDTASLIPRPSKSKTEQWGPEGTPSLLVIHIAMQRFDRGSLSLFDRMRYVAYTEWQTELFNSFGCTAIFTHKNISSNVFNSLYGKLSKVFARFRPINMIDPVKSCNNVTENNESRIHYTISFPIFPFRISLL